MTHRAQQHSEVEPRFERTAWLIDRDDSNVEDVRESEAAGVDFKPDEPSAMPVAREAGQVVPLGIAVLGKVELGITRADGTAGHDHKASPLDIGKSMDAGEVFALAVQECIRQFRANEAPIIAERDPDALHQARVAIRRLRAAFSLFGPAIRKGSIEPLRNELRDFIGPFGQARNLDVFLANHGEELDTGDRRKLIAARDATYDEVIETLGARHSHEMFVDLVEWTASGDWRKKSAAEPIRKFAGRRLDRAWTKIKRKGARLSDLEEIQLHRLRIAIKKLRYGVDFLAPAYARKRVRKFASSLERMQDCLGNIHDDMVSRQIAADFALAETHRTAATGRARQLKALEKRFRHLRRVGRFWAG